MAVGVASLPLVVSVTLNLDSIASSAMFSFAQSFDKISYFGWCFAC